MKFIPLHDANTGQVIYINPCTVIRIRPVQGKTELLTNGTSSHTEQSGQNTFSATTSYYIYVTETPERIMELLRK